MAIQWRCAHPPGSIDRTQTNTNAPALLSLYTSIRLHSDQVIRNKDSFFLFKKKNIFLYLHVRGILASICEDSSDSRADVVDFPKIPAHNKFLKR